MKMKRIISFVASVVISAALLASCAVTPTAPAPQSMDVTARVPAATEDGHKVSLIKRNT